MAAGAKSEHGSNPPAATPARSRLGRGLSSLIHVSVPDTAPTAADATPQVAGIPESVAVPVGTPLRVPIGHLAPNPHQPRRTFDMPQLAELAASIKANGIIQPLVVRPAGVVDGHRRFELIAGERRWRAAQMAGLPDVPVVIMDVDGFSQAQMALVENIQRQDLPILERAAAYKSLMTQLGLTQAELAGRLGEDRSAIANYLRLLELPEPVRKLVASGDLTLGHAKLLAGVTDILEQERLAKLVVAQGLSVRNLERAILASAVKPAAEKPVPADSAQAGRAAYYAKLEKTISSGLGMRVQLRAGKGKGKLTIHYATLDQFDQLMEKLGVEVHDE